MPRDEETNVDDSAATHCSPPWYVHVWVLSPTQGWVEVGTYQFERRETADLFPHHGHKCDPAWVRGWTDMLPNVEFRVDHLPPRNPAVNTVGCCCRICAPWYGVASTTL